LSTHASGGESPINQIGNFGSPVEIFINLPCNELH
jgi:hypothetical protein